MPETGTSSFADRPEWIIRRVTPADMPALLQLCIDHAIYEKTIYTTEDVLEPLSRALFSQPPRLWSWVAEADGALVGYATASLEFSTWSAREYLHMDCLFLSEPWRGKGAGRALIDAVIDLAKSKGVDRIEWQTPEWNTGAVRFYKDVGATATMKLRFTLRTDPSVRLHGQ